MKDRFELTEEEANQLRRAYDDEADARQAAEIVTLRARADLTEAILKRQRLFVALARAHGIDTTADYSFEGAVLTKKPTT